MLNIRLTTTSSNMRESFIFYRSWFDALGYLPPALRGEVLDAILTYGLNGMLPNCLSQEAQAYMALITPQIDANLQRFENGKKGGAPKGNQNARKKNNQNQPKTTENNQNQPNVNVNVNENENEYDNYNEYEYVNDSHTHSLIYPFTTQRFIDAWSMLLLQPKWEGRSQESLQLTLDKLKKYEEGFAVKMILEAISRNWGDVEYESTPDKYRVWKESQPKAKKPPTEQEKELLSNIQNNYAKLKASNQN